MDINTYGRIYLTATIKVEDFFIEKLLVLLLMKQLEFKLIIIYMVEV